MNDEGFAPLYSFNDPSSLHAGGMLTSDPTTEKLDGP
jgi:hypothetical protein